MTDLTDTPLVLPAHVPVVVIGGGPVGCALGVELAHHGVAALVVDKDAVVPPNPVKAMLLNPRTLEQFRRWGLAETLRAAATTPAAWQRDVVFATSLTGRELGHFRQAFAFRAAQDSDKVAESAQVVMQPDTTRVLRDKLVETGGRLALGWSCVGLRQDENGCTVELVEDATGRRHTVTSDYVAGCDGPQSLVRTSAGISRSGRGGLSANLLLHWRSPQVLDDYRLTPAAFTGLYHPHGNALCVPIDREHWCAHVAGYSIDTDIDTVDVQSVIRRIVGEGIDFEVTFAGVYKVHERIADSYRAGRFFLAGDAAHLYAPFGGHNMNSGLGDAANLGWKLAAVLHGWGGDALLDTYQDERRPIAVTNATEASGNVARFVGAAKDVLGSMDPTTIDADGFEAESRRRGWGDALWAATTPQFLSDGITLDQRYASDIVVDDGTSVAPWESTTYVVSSKPGHRAPHLWLSEGVSIYDLLGSGHTLLHHPGHSAQAAVFASAAAAAGVPLTTLELSGDVARARYDRPLTLVRPDLQVAWRGYDAAAAASVLRQVSGHLPAAVELPDELVSAVTPAFA